MRDLLLDAIAVYRLTRLVTADVLLDAPREAIVKMAYTAVGRYREVADDADRSSWAEVAIGEGRHAPRAATLVVCRFCAGAWIGLGVVAARRYAPRLWDPLARALTFSAGAALLAGLEDD